MTDSPALMVIIGLLLAAAAVPAHTLALPNVGGYLPDADRRGRCTCCCPRSGGSGASRPPTGAVWRAWVSTQERRNTARRCGFGKPDSAVAGAGARGPLAAGYEILTEI